MSLKETCAFLQGLPSDIGAPLLLAALDEPSDRAVGEASTNLVERKFSNYLPVLFRKFPSFSEEVRSAVLEKRWILVPIAKSIIAYGAPDDRSSVLQLAPFLNEGDAMEILVAGLSEGSGAWREAVIARCREAARIFIERIRSLRADEEQHYREEVVPKVAEAISTIVDRSEESIFLETLAECGDETYRTLTNIALTKAHTPLYNSLQEIFVALNSSTTVSTLFKLSAEQSAHLHMFAAEVFSRKGGGAFVDAMADYLRRIGDEAQESLAKRTKVTPWWKAVVDYTAIGASSAEAIMDFIVECNLDMDEKREKVVHFLSIESPDAKIYALRLLDEIGYKDMVGACERLLGDESDDVKFKAVSIIVEKNPPTKAKLLLPLLHSTDERISKTVMRAISKESFDRYMKAFDKLDDETKESAAKAIAKMDADMSDRIVEEIHALDPARRLKALRIIEFVDREHELGNAVMELISDPDRKVRATVVKIMGLTGSTGAIRTLIKALSDPDRRVRANAVEAFEDTGDVRFIQLLKPFLRDPDNRVRGNVVKALWHLGDSNARGYLEEMLKSVDPVMRLSAVWVVGELEIADGKEMLRNLVAGETDEKVREKAMEVIEKS